MTMTMTASSTMNLRKEEDEVASSLLFMAALQHQHHIVVDAITDGSSDEDDSAYAPTSDSDEDSAPSPYYPPSKKRSLFLAWRSKCRVVVEEQDSPKSAPSVSLNSPMSVSADEPARVVEVLNTPNKKRKTCSTATSWRQERRLINTQVSSPFVSNTSLHHSMRLQAEAQAKASASTALSREALRTLRNQQAHQLQAAARQASEFSALSRQALALQSFLSPQEVTATSHDKCISGVSTSTGRVSVCSSSDSDSGSSTSNHSEGSPISPIPSELVVKKNENVITTSSSSTSSAKSSSPSKHSSRKFSRYNLFYRLERHLLLHQRGANNQVTSNSSSNSGNNNNEAKNKFYQALGLPSLPTRYEGVPVPKFWFLSSKGNDKKRSHRKSHGVASFTEIAQIVAANWKCCDEETMEFVTGVSKKLKEVYAVYESSWEGGSSSSSSVTSDNSAIADETTSSTPSTLLNAKNTHKMTMKKCVPKRCISKVSLEDVSTTGVLSKEDHALFQSAMMRQVKKRRAN